MFDFIKFFTALQGVFQDTKRKVLHKGVFQDSKNGTFDSGRRRYLEQMNGKAVQKSFDIRDQKVMAGNWSAASQLRQHSGGNHHEYQSNNKTHNKYTCIIRGILHTGKRAYFRMIKE